ncbi:MAG: glutamate racemase [Elusimicrobia bacterium]|nr:glutamate racemase [Elusimicrobiota bacterium]
MKPGQRPIGVFDSGVGGLTVLDAIMRQLPHEPTIYFGDTARVPYGSKSQAVVTRFSLEIAEFLMRQRVKMLVVACNTASAYALSALTDRLSIPVIGVIEPGVRAALTASRNRRIGVIGTEGTIRSGAYARAIQRLDGKARIFGQTCPLFVPLVEEGWIRHPVTLKIAGTYLRPLLRRRIDTLVLGCTHYPLLKGVLQEVTSSRGNGRGNTVALIDSAEETATVVSEVLDSLGLKRRAASPPERRYFVTDAPKKFIQFGLRFLRKRLTPVHLVDIGTWI